MDALRQLGRPEAGFYPDYEDAQQAVAGNFGVPPEYVLLTNGLDEGILAACAAAFRDRSGGIPETLGVVPAFDMYEIFTTALGGHTVNVPCGPGFTAPLDRLRQAVTPRTRIVFLANPHNPSGVPIPLDDLQDLGRTTAPAMFFVDEAYADFSGDTLIETAAFDAMPSLLVGRTFSKAYGIAGLRVGAVLGHPSTLAPLRQVVPPYSLNAWATAALPVDTAGEALAATAEPMAAETLLPQLLSQATERQSWGREAASILTMRTEGLALRLDGGRLCGLIAQGGGESLRIQMAYFPPALSDGAVAALLRRAAGAATTVQLYNEPEDSGLLARYRRLGFGEFFSQHEMWLTL